MNISTPPKAPKAKGITPNPKPSAAKKAKGLHPAIKSVSSTDHKTTAIESTPPPKVPRVTRHTIHEVPGQTAPVAPVKDVTPAPKAPRTAKATNAQVSQLLAASSTTTDAGPTEPKANKGKVIAALVTRPGGATMEAMMAASGWQAHSVRGFLAAGIKKQGLQVTSAKVDGVRVYTATATPAAGAAPSDEPI